MACLKTYLHFIESRKLNKPNSIIVCTATGMKLDISGLQSDTIQNVLFTENSHISNYFKTEYSLYARVLNGKVDTSIVIEPNTVHGAIEYLSSNHNNH